MAREDDDESREGLLRPSEVDKVHTAQEDGYDELEILAEDMPLAGTHSKDTQRARWQR